MKSSWLLVIFTLFLSACSSNPDKDRELTEREYYEQAREALDDGSLVVASDRLQKLESHYPFGRYAEQAQLELIYINYKMSDLDSVLATSERFIRLHPLHEQVDYAYYMRGLATYEMGFAFVERYLSDDIPKRDTQPLEDAFNHFAELLDRYPNSRYVDDSRKRMIFIRERLASYDIGIARYYMKRHAFLAAANRCENILLHHQKTAAVADSLAIMVEAYDELKMTSESEQALALLKQNYPDHPQLKDGKFKSSGLAMVDRRSLLNVITFGLLD
jgi:outer membrane protein assembly factor BamD